MIQISLYISIFQSSSRWGNIGLSNALAPFLEPIMTQFTDTMWRHHPLNHKELMHKCIFYLHREGGVGVLRR